MQAFTHYTNNTFMVGMRVRVTVCPYVHSFVGLFLYLSEYVYVCTRVSACVRESICICLSVNAWVRGCTHYPMHGKLHGTGTLHLCRYKNVLPTGRTRVVLPPSFKLTGGDQVEHMFINANYIATPTGKQQVTLVSIGDLARSWPLKT